MLLGRTVVSCCTASVLLDKVISENPFLEIDETIV